MRTPLPGDILFTYQKGDIISRLIWKVSGINTKRNKKVRLSHTAMIDVDGKIIDIQWNGVIRRKLKEYDPNKYILHIGYCPTLSDNDREDLIKDARGFIGQTMYPLLQLLVIGIKELLHLKKSFDISKRDLMCTEFNVNRYRVQGIELVEGVEPYDVTPLALFNDPLLITYKYK